MTSLSRYGALPDRIGLHTPIAFEILLSEDLMPGIEYLLASGKGIGTRRKSFRKVGAYRRIGVNTSVGV